jgi:hypothetical protein
MVSRKAGSSASVTFWRYSSADMPGVSVWAAMYRDDQSKGVR